MQVTFVVEIEDPTTISLAKAGSIQYTGKQYVQYVTELANGTEQVETAGADISYGFLAEGIGSAGDSTNLTDVADQASSLSFASSLAAFAVAFSMMNV